MLHQRRIAGGSGRTGIGTFDSSPTTTREKFQKPSDHPRGADKTRRRVPSCSRRALLKRVVLIVFGFIFMWYLVINPGLIHLVGDGYGVQGGLLGRAADRWLEQFHLTREAQRRAISDSSTSIGLRFPSVVLRSNRKEVPGYSRFLEEVLSLRREQRSSDLWAQPLPRTTRNRAQQSGQAAVASWDIHVQLVETDAAIGGLKNSSKVSVMEQLRRANCRPGWLCHRCLNTRIYGSLSSCESVCPSCYANILCGVGEETVAQVAVNVTRKQSNCSKENCGGSLPLPHSLIPKVIHQFWSEPLSTLRCPELVRIQNGWRSSGFRYHFYTPASARTFVEQHYPARFLRAYDSIRSFDVQSDLFRLLVLFQEGGIYANVDLMLETKLESLVTPNLLFFAARDDSTFDHCLWNGLIGAQAGHPFIGQAIESFMETVLNRLGLDDMERGVCRTMGRDAASWKLRTYPEESVFGSCALGIAVHQASGHENVLQSFPLGLLPDHPIHVGTPARENATMGENIILLMSKDDTGAFRCSDVERNLLVASTAMLGLTTESLKSRTKTTALRSPRSQSLLEADLYVEEGTSGESIRFVYSSQGS